MKNGNRKLAIEFNYTGKDIDQSTDKYVMTMSGIFNDFGPNSTKIKMPKDSKIDAIISKNSHSDNFDKTDSDLSVIGGDIGNESGNITSYHQMAEDDSSYCVNVNNENVAHECIMQEKDDNGIYDSQEKSECEVKQHTSFLKRIFVSLTNFLQIPIE